MAYPAEFSVIAPILKKTLKEKQITYRDFAKKLHMSEANVKKMMNAKDCSLKRLNQICEALDLTVFDLLEFLRQRPVRRVLLGPDQQALLTRDELNLLLYFKIAFENVSPEQAKKELKLSDVAFQKKLRSLEPGGLLKRNSRGTLTVPDEYIGVWPDEGPLAKFVKNEWSLSVLKTAAQGHQNSGEDLSLRYFRLSEKSLQELHQRMIELMNDYERTSLIESKLFSHAKHVSCLYAIVPNSLTNIRRNSSFSVSTKAMS